MTHHRQRSSFALPPLFSIVAGICAYSLPRQYYSHATLEFHGGDAGIFLQAFEQAAQPYRGAAEAREVRNTSLWQIGVDDSSPQQAAERANSIAAASSLLRLRKLKAQ